MSTDYKASVKAAIESWINKQAEANRPKTEHRKKNASPERDVQHEVMAWLKANSFDCQVYESKSVYVNGRWTNPGLKAGNADIQGASPDGFAVYIELKAPGKRSSFWRVGNERQQDFILSKISNNAFACVIDNVRDLERLYETYLKARDSGLAVARNLLMDHLPRKPKREEPEIDLFD